MREVKEVWADILRFPGYRVSNFGRVFNVRTNRMLTSAKSKQEDNKRYPDVSLGRGDGRWFNVGIHILVAHAFVDGWFEGAEVNHKDGIKANSHASNLEWVTHQQNMQHAYATGLNPTRRIRIVEIINPEDR